jgi:hypothetical protein
VDWKWLLDQPAAAERSYCRYLRLDEPVTVLMDGRSQRGVILKPGVPVAPEEPE